MGLSAIQFLRLDMVEDSNIPAQICEVLLLLFLKSGKVFTFRVGFTVYVYSGIFGGPREFWLSLKFDGIHQFNLPWSSAQVLISSYHQLKSPPNCGTGGCSA